MRGLLAAGLLLLLAGCSSPPPDGPGPLLPESPVEAQGTPAFELIDCSGQMVFFVFDQDAVEATMPTGYRAYTVQGVAGALVGFIATTCDVVVGDQVVVDVPIARNFVQVGPTTMYMFEWLFPVERAPALAEWLASQGWTVVDAQVEMLPGLLTIRGDEVDYVIADLPSAAGGARVTGASGGAIHFVHGDGPVRLDENQTMDVPVAGASTPTLVATRGAFAAFAPGPASATGASAAAGLAFLDLTMSSVFTVPPPEQAIEPVRS